MTSVYDKDVSVLDAKTMMMRDMNKAVVPRQYVAYAYKLFFTIMRVLAGYIFVLYKVT